MIKIYDSKIISREEILSRGSMPDFKKAEETVAEIISAVRSRGDEAIKEYCLRFDGCALDSLKVSNEEIDEAFSSLDTNLVNFMKILSERREAHSIPGVAKEYLALYDTSRGIERVTAVTAIAMTDTQTKAMTEKLEKITGKKIIITNILEPAMLGGVKIRYSGKQLDGSLKTRLEDFENRLKNIVI